jgi:hypothetical protein
MPDASLSHWAKWDRGKEHFESLERELVAFLQPDCYEITYEVEVETERESFLQGVARRRVNFKRDLPLFRLGVLVGDVIQNLRASLDHVIYAISYSRDADAFRHDRSTEFPICDSADTFNRTSHRHEIRGLPEEAQRIVERHQPYHNPTGLTADPLWALREMSNVDKHRTINLTIWHAIALRWDITSIPPGIKIHSHWLRPIGPIESGAILAEMRFTNEGPAEAAVETYKEFYSRLLSVRGRRSKANSYKRRSGTSSIV